MLVDTPSVFGDLLKYPVRAAGRRIARAGREKVEVLARPEMLSFAAKRMPLIGKTMASDFMKAVAVAFPADDEI